MSKDGDSGPTSPKSAGTDLSGFWRALADEPWQHDFYSVLRRIDASQPGKPRLGAARRPVDEPLRLGQTPDLSFAPSALHSVDLKGPKPRIAVRFFGLFGPNGPLPLHLTEHAREREIHHGDHTLSRFADLFHHRLLLLFYRAWAQAQPTVNLDRPDSDRFAAQVGSLVGIGEPSLRDRDAAPDHARLHFAGVLSRQVRNAEGLEKLVSGVLGRSVRVEQFVGTWMKLPTSERTRIGRSAGSRHNPGACLGLGAVLGGMVWDRQHHFRIHIGPLGATVFDSLLPDGAALPVVVALVKHYVGDELGWDLQLQHDGTELRPTRPGRFGRLGWTSWLGLGNVERDSAPALRPGPHLKLSPDAGHRRRAASVQRTSD